MPCPGTAADSDVCRFGINSYYAKLRISRLYANLVRQRLAKFHAVAIVGPRQYGKTTLARQFGGIYFDLEQEAAQTQLDA